ncbi:MAG: NAD(+) synthase [Clostridiaceae bacterium]|nr:NAD(+) synthase [Clostridiaceae bacterium]
MKNYGFVRVASAVPEIRVADCRFNTEKIIGLMEEAAKQELYVTVFPELCITGYTCGDLFRQSKLLESAMESLKIILHESNKWSNIFILGIPLLLDQSLYNCAVIIQKGRIHGIVPKSNIASHNGIIESKWFRTGVNLDADYVKLFDKDVPAGVDLIFQDRDNQALQFAVEISEDMIMPIPPSSAHALNGAVIIFNLSASAELAGKKEILKNMVKSQSARCISGYVYSSAGVGESSTDMVFGGLAIISEHGTILTQNERFSSESQLIFTEIDVQKLIHDRANSTSFTGGENKSFARKIQVDSYNIRIGKMTRTIKKHPFIPADPEIFDERCREIFLIQSAGLAKRYEHTGFKKAFIGVSGGLDSTLALMVVTHAFDRLKLGRENIIAVTMPGFGTTDQTYRNAIDLMNSLQVHIREINIKDACLQHFSDIGHDPDIHDVTYENVQARERTQILMDIANKESGMVIGTGDLSELALGWCTYNGDHISMYSVNCGVPKTLVKHLVKWVALNIADKETALILERIVGTPITPELLPPSETGGISQKTEDIVGPYELHDFFLYHMVRYGAEPGKILFLAKTAFQGQYDEKTIIKWLRSFYKRFFTQQFKRSCLPDGPKIGTIGLSPRGDWCMPSDACYRIWMDELD